MNTIKKNNLLDFDLLLNKVDLANNAKVADLGCGGYGYFVFPLAKKIGKHGKIFAVDIIKENLEAVDKVAKVENLSQIKTIWSNLEVYNGTKIESDSLDLVLLVSILHQSKNYIDILREASRMLKLGGKMLIVDWNDLDSPYNSNPDSKIKLAQLTRDLDKMPLELIENFSAGRFHYGLLLIKK